MARWFPHNPLRPSPHLWLRAAAVSLPLMPLSEWSAEAAGSTEKPTACPRGDTNKTGKRFRESCKPDLSHHCPQNSWSEHPPAKGCGVALRGLTIRLIKNRQPLQSTEVRTGSCRMWGELLSKPQVVRPLQSQRGIGGGRAEGVDWVPESGALMGEVLTPVNFTVCLQLGILCKEAIVHNWEAEKRTLKWQLSSEGSASH